MRIVDSFEPTLNFWIEHVQLAAAGPIKKLYEEDKSKNKIESSKLMWCIVLIWDFNSKFYNLPEKGDDSKIDLIFGDYYGDPEYYTKNKDFIDDIKNHYLKLQETPARRSLRSIEEKLEEREVFLNNTKYDLGIVNEKGQWVGNTASILDTMFSNTKKIYDLYDQALKLVAAESIEDDDQVKGGGTLSLSDKGEI